MDTTTGTAFLEAVAARLPNLRVLTDPLDLDGYRRDETAYLEPPPPLAVALPTETAEVAELVRLAALHRVPIVPRGAGSGLSGGAISVAGGLTISFMRMNRILEIDRANLVVITQPGILNAALKRAVAAEGLFYAPDPASTEICSIGGNLGTNAGGLCCLKYGVTRDAVIGLEIVTATGEIVRLGGRTTKDVAGYGLIPLIVGSQGTLALITEATLRLRPTPPPKATLLAFFPTLTSAGDAVSALAEAGVEPCTLELMDRTTIRAVDDDHHLGLDRDAAAMLMIESDLPGAAATRALEIAQAACLGAGAISTIVAAERGRGGSPAPGPAAGLQLDGAPGRRPDGGRRRAPRPGPGAARRDRADRRRAGLADRHVRPRRRRQPPPEHHPGPRRSGRREEAEQGDRCPLPGGHRPGRHGHRRAWDRHVAAGVPRAPARQRRRGHDAGGQDRLDPLGILNPGKVLPDA